MVGIVAIVAASFFLIGRSTAPTKTETVYKTEYITSRLTEDSKEEDLSKTTTVVERVDGTKITRTKIAKNNKVINKAKEVVETKTTDVKTVENKKTFILGPSIGLNINNIFGPPSFGMHGYGQVLGPFGVGTSFLTNGQFQIYAGIEF